MVRWRQKRFERQQLQERMTFELSKKELGIIELWYCASAGESAHHRDDDLFALLDKLGIEAHGGDLWLPDIDHFTEEYRPTVEAHRKAILAYRARHPEMECVKEVEESQPQ